MIDVGIAGGPAQSRVRVSARGQLVTSPLDFSTFYTGITTVNNTPVNLVEPMAGMNFVITALILSGDRNIGANGAVTEVYENALGPTDATVTKPIYRDEIARQARAVLTGLNIILTEGRWINVKSDDVQVRANIAGYYVPAIG